MKRIDNIFYFWLLWGAYIAGAVAIDLLLRYFNFWSPISAGEYSNLLLTTVLVSTVQTVDRMFKQYFGIL